jgi:PAS domain S-box-containing protein
MPPAPTDSTSLDSEDLLQVVLAASLAGVALLRPVRAANGDLIDFTYTYLNPAAQHLLGLPERPAAHSATYPGPEQATLLDFYQVAYGAAQPTHYTGNYPLASGTRSLQVAAHRSGELLVLSLAEAPAPSPALAEAEQQEQQLYHLLQQAPAMICIFEGPQHTFQFVNPTYQALVGRRPLVGKPIAEAMPELAGQPIFDLLNQVYQTGETYQANEMLVQLDHDNQGNRDLEKRYYNFTYQARRNERKVITGIFVFAYDVTPLVKARQQAAHQEEHAQQLNEKLATSNEELANSNGELLSANEQVGLSNMELLTVQAELRFLNQELEVRVAERTRALTQALNQAEYQRVRLQAQERQLHQILRQVPAAVATLEGPDHRYSFYNTRYQELVRNRAQPGLPIAEVLPELAAQGFVELLDQVYATGQPISRVEAPVMLYDPTTQESTQIYVNFVYQPLLTEQGQPHSILAFILDVTESVRSRQRADAAQAQALAAAEQLAQQRETYYRIFEQTPAAVAILRGPEHQLDYFNPAYQQLFPKGLTAGRTIAELQPEAVEHGFVALLDHVFETGETHFGYEHMLAIQQPDGQPPRPAYFDFTYQLFMEDGRPAGISVFASEVTERVLARQQHEAQQAVLKRVFEQAPVAMGVFAGPNHVVEVCNPGLQAIWGRTEAQVLGKPLHEAMPEFQDQGFDKLLSEVLRTGVPYTAQELPLRVRHQGELTTVYVNFVYQPLRDAQGQFTAVAAVATDISEQVRARQASEAATRQLQLLTDALPVLISYIDQEEKYQFANYGYEAWFGQKPEALLGRPVREVVGESAYQNITSYIRRGLAGERLDFESRMAYRPDFVRHIRTSYVPDVRGGEVKGLYSLVLDITDRVQAQQEAERQRAVLHTLFMSAPASICIFAGPDLVYELVNPSYQHIFPGRTLLGRPVLEALPELADTPVLTSLREVYRTGVAAEFQEVLMQLARHEGGPLEECFFTFTYQARYGTSGAVDGVLVFAYEVTDQVRARRLVERSEQYLRRMADTLPAMIWLTDSAGQCTYLNQQWYHYTGKQPGAGLGEGWLQVVHPADAAATRTVFFDATSQRAPFSVLYRQRRQDGRYRWVLDTGAPRYNRAGEFDGFVGTVFDIHEQKQAEQALQRLTTTLRTARDRAQSLNTELQASNEQLRRTNVDLDNFIYTASHDLKAPITNIEGLAHALHDQLPAEGELAEAVAPLLGMMQDSIERFQRTLDHLSDVTKLQKEHDQPLAQVALGTIVEEVCLDLQPLLHSSGAQLTTDVSACPTVAFAPKNLRSVVYNLLSNALKYRDSARQLAVSINCHTEDGYVVLRVQDNGLGLDASQQAELFTMFRRFHVGVEGSGIGLYMVKKVVENAGGKLAVESEPGVGSVFSVYFRR